MKRRHMRQAFSSIIDFTRSLLPKKGKEHFDHFAYKRRRRNDKTRLRDPKRQSFRRYWREVRLKTWIGATRPQHSRQTRREWARAWYKLDKHRGVDGP